MGEVHLDRRELDDVMGVIGRQREQRPMATGTRSGLKQRDLRGTSHGGSVARMAQTRSVGGAGTTGLARGLVKRRI